MPSHPYPPLIVSQGCMSPRNRHGNHDVAVSWSHFETDPDLKVLCQRKTRPIVNQKLKSCAVIKCWRNLNLYVGIIVWIYDWPKKKTSNKREVIYISVRPKNIKSFCDIISHIGIPVQYILYPPHCNMRRTRNFS